MKKGLQGAKKNKSNLRLLLHKESLLCCFEWAQLLMSYTFIRFEHFYTCIFWSKMD